MLKFNIALLEQALVVQARCSNNDREADFVHLEQYECGNSDKIVIKECVSVETKNIPRCLREHKLINTVNTEAFFKVSDASLCVIFLCFQLDP